MLLDHDRPIFSKCRTTNTLANLEVFIGKGLVQVAKLHADTFRTQVGIVSEAQRGRLQLCMQQALQTETAGARPLGGAGRPAAPMSLQIDASS